jgi:tetratricopeptide (TPR) repeat protein
MALKPFSRARKLFRKHRFEELINLLEPQVFRFRESFRFYYLLGFSCLQVGDYGSAYTYLKRGHDLNNSDVDTLLGLAAVHLKRQETSESLQLWLEVLEKDGKNSFALKGMKLLKKHSEPEFIVDYIESGKISRLYPQPAKPIPPFLIPLLLILLIIGSAVTFLNPLSPFSLLPEKVVNTLPVPPLSDIQGELIESPKSDDPYSYTTEEIESIFKRIETYFHQERDNLVRREINRIALSNASLPVREKAQLISSYLKEPSFSRFKDNFTYSQVMQEPELYSGCYVIWKGAVGNLSYGEKEITFDLLIGYEKGRVVEGIVPVIVPFASRIDPELAIEVLAEVQLKSTASPQLQLTAVSVHQFIQD